MNKKYAPFVKAVLYADIFDYPLLASEIWKFMIGTATKEDFKQFIAKPPSFIRQHDGYFYLKNRKELVEKRLKRQSVGRKKLLIAKKAGSLLASIPTIQCIGISGGLSLLNTDVKDDIDLFIITKKNTVWTTRLLVVVLLEVFGLRRKRNGKRVSDSICVNMYLDEDALPMARDWRDLYTAHEVMQMTPLFSRYDTYNTFLLSNKWINRYLPNAPEQCKGYGYVHSASDAWLKHIVSNAIIERFVRFAQEWYMRRHRTREVVSATILAFHPLDYRGDTLMQFEKRVQRYEKI